MTLILTTLDANKIIQVSDQRLTFKGRSYDEHALKTIYMKSKDATCCVSFTGRAYIGRPLRRTDFWLCDNLQPLTYLPLPQIVEGLAIRLSAVNLGGDILTVVGAGYKDGTSWPLLFIVSNLHDPQGKQLATPLRYFTTNFWAPSDNAETRAVLLDVRGTKLAVAGSARRHLIRFAQKRLRGATVSASVKVLVYAIRAASQRSRLVGSSCVGIALAPGQDAEALYWPDGDVPREVMPHVVTESSVLRSIRIGSPVESPSAKVPFEDWPDLAAIVEYKDGFLTVTNTSTENWRFVRLDLNGRPTDYREIAQGWEYGPGYVYFLPFLGAGKTTAIGVFSFATMTDGKPFNPMTEPIRDLVLISQLPDGRFARYVLPRP